MLELSPEIVERLVGSILEASDPWRALNDVRRKLSVEPVIRTFMNESIARGRNTTFLDTVRKEGLPSHAALRLTFALFTIGIHNR